MLQPLGRAKSIRRALLFLSICAPLYLAPRMFAVAHPGVWVAAILALTFLFLRHDGRTLAVLGIEPSWRPLGGLLGGYAGGALLIVITAACIRMVLPFPWAYNPQFNAAAAVYSAIWLTLGNSVEELIFRGYSFERLIAGVGHWRAQLLTALLFAVFHIAQGWPWQSALMGTTIGSLLFGLVFVRWRSVPTAVGVHAAANWARDLLLSDPPTAKTVFGPLSPRRWTYGEQVVTAVIFDGVMLLACYVLWRSINRNPLRVLPAMTEIGHQDGAAARLA
ncbi:MAG: CPBP family intramembrane glutamic endopeptidase [bacterium]